MTTQTFRHQNHRNPSYQDAEPRFELAVNGKILYLDLTTLLQCLKIAEHTHLIPTLDPSWWLDIARQYPVELNLDGRIHTQDR